MALAYLLSPTFEFVNTAGKPVTGGYLEVYVSGTRDKYYCASDFDGTLHPFRIPLDSLGANVVLAEEGKTYDVYCYNRYGSLLMSRYGIKPGAGGGSSVDSITSTDGSIIVTETENGVDLSVNSEPPTSMRCSGEDLLVDGTFQFAELERDGLNASVYNHNVLLNKGWWHYDAAVRLQWNGSSNSTTPVQLYSAGSSDSMEFDLSYAHSETVQVSGEQKVNADGTQFVLGVTGIPTGMRVSLVDFGIHSITGEGAGGTYYAGTGIVINESDRLISVDTDTIQEKLTAGSNIVIEDNVISATAEPQEQADWNQSDSSEVDYIKNKPDISGMISSALSDYTPTASLASVALSGDYDDLVDKPDLSVYATTSDLTTGLAGKQDTISDLSDIRSGAALGATAVQPAALNDYATTTDLTNGLAGKQDTLTAGSNITISNNVISASAAPQEQADWAETDNTKVDYIKNKPANLVQDANYVHTDNNFTNADATKLSGIATGAEVNVQADWSESDSSSDAFIQNKPAIPRPLSAGTGIAITNDVVSVKLADNSIASDTDGLSVAHPVPDPNYAAPGTVLTVRGGDMVWAQQSVTGVEVNGTSVVDSSGLAQITIPPSVTDVEVNGSSVVDSSGIAQITVPPVPSMKELVAGANITITEGANNVTIAATVPSVPVTDVEVGGSSVVNAQGVAEVPAQVNADWDAVSGAAQVLNKPSLASVALSGDYDDLTNKPTIPAALSAGNGIDITSNVVSVDLDGSTLTNGANGLSVTLPVPDTTGASQGDVLSVGSNGIEWATPSSNSDLFYATWGSTTFTEVQNAVNAGKYVVLTRQGYIIPISGIFGTGQFTTAYFQTISNPYNSDTRNNLRLITYSLNANNQWNYFLTFVPPDSTASDAGKVLMVNSSGNSEWTASTVPTIGTITI